MSSYRIAPAAFADIEEASDYLNDADPDAAARWVDDLADALDRLADLPRMG